MRIEVAAERDVVWLVHYLDEHGVPSPPLQELTVARLTIITALWTVVL
ncbi:hypothetical protein [Krasilnikovia sp. M28-CT-15]